jgi:hypothetical protein
VKTISDKALSELETKHGKVEKVEAGGGDIVLRKPTKAEFKAAWAKGVFDLKMNVSYDALDRLVRDLCVFPDRETLDKMIDDAPGVILLCLNPVVSLSGMAGREAAGKP